MLTHSKTERGFSLIEFKDRYGSACSIQKSSLATEDAIWFGCDDANPQVMASEASSLGVETTATTGWVPYPISDKVLLTTSMHLTREQVCELLPVLNYFAITGELAEPDKLLYQSPIRYTTLEAQRDECVAALKGVVRVADRATVEFDAARAAIARCER